MKPVLLLNVVGLTPRQLGAGAPRLNGLARAAAPMSTVLPAVTMSAQATMLTGLRPAEHGAVGNGWYWRDRGEVAFWKQSNAIVTGPKLYERGRERDGAFTSAKLFWWWNQGAAVDLSVTPKPHYAADGRKLLDIDGWPRTFPDELKAELGDFPFFDFWGPRSGLASSKWIAEATKLTLERHRPTLTLAYLPHLDYDHQRFGPESPEGLRALAEVDAVAGDLVEFASARGVETVVVSEYGLEDADTPVHVNRALREAGLLEVRDGPIGESLDPFASAAFAVADHQVAHVYARDERARAAAREVLAGLDGVAEVLGEDGKRAAGLAHQRAGDLVAVARPGAWFTYYYWLDDARAPDFARTVDIHRKPGYDPCELFVDPDLRSPALRVANRLARKKLGMRYLMDVIPLDASLVRGTHGRLPAFMQDGPVFLSTAPFEALGGDPEEGVVHITSVPDRVLSLVFDDVGRRA
jgi:predicted AlkP superfamily pyrophosphatase or phosphodiesterase